MINDTNKDTWCVHAFHSISGGNDGRTKLCCMYTPDPSGDRGSDLVLGRNHLDDHFNRDEFEQVREDLLSGVKNKRCGACWEEEKVGRSSKRMRDNDKYQHYVDGNKPYEGLAIVELNLGNTCNLSCRTCTPYVSTGWMQEAYDTEYPTQEISYKEYANNFKTFHRSYDDDSAFWLELKEKLPNIKQFDFYGGEPFMSKKMWELLRYAVEQGFSHDIELHYNTNGTHLPPDIKLWQHFKEVNVSFSIDGIGESFEYMRYPAKWNHVDGNMKQFHETCNDYGNVHFNWCITVSTSNVYEVPVILDYFYEHYEPIGFQMYLNLVHGPLHYNIGSLPDTIKKHVEDRLLSVPKDQTAAWDHIPGVINFMNQGQHYHAFNKFLEVTEQSDRYRKQDFRSVFKDYSKYFYYTHINYMHIELTNRCNAACPMCMRFYQSSPLLRPDLVLNEITVDQFKKWFSVQFLKGIKFILFCGTQGDPIVAKDVFEITKYIVTHSPHLHLQFNTNGGMRTPEWWSEFGSLLKLSNNQYRVIFSIDGLEDTNHIYRRNVQWDKLMKNVKAFISAGGNACWEYLIFKHNEHQIDQALSLAKELKFIQFTPKKALGVDDGVKLHSMGVLDKHGKLDYIIDAPEKAENRNLETPVGVSDMVSGYEFTKEEYNNLKNDISLKEYRIKQQNEFYEHINKDDYLDENNRTIKCKSIRGVEHEIFVDNFGNVLPCCYIGTHYTGPINTPETEQLRHEISKSGIEKINLNYYSIEDMLNNRYLEQIFNDSWTKPSIAEGKLLFCSNTCGECSSIDRIFTHKQNTDLST